MSEKMIIIGSGPAGYTAGVYAARAKLAPILFAGSEQGGQLTYTTEVENFPGFPDGVQGPDLMDRMKKQAEKFGTKVLHENVTAVDFSQHPFKVMTDSKTYEAETVIIATGARALRLGLPSEDALWGKGISACATCDGFFFRDKEVVMVGGGDAALEEATFLTRFAKKVTIVHRRDTLRASQPLQDRAKNDPKIDFIWNSEVVEVLGVAEGRVTGVTLKNNQTNEVTNVKTDGLFVAIGHTPATEIFKEQIDLDVKGYVITKSSTTETSVPGIFAAGDVADHRYRQAVTAAGTGCAAALDAEKFLEGRNE